MSNCQVCDFAVSMNITGLGSENQNTSIGDALRITQDPPLSNGDETPVELNICHDGPGVDKQ